jgi:hypothetical protein
LTAVDHLDLSFNALTGTLPPSWSNIGSTLKFQTAGGGLKQLWLDVNQLSGSLPESWGGFGALQRLFLSENKLSGTLPESFSSMTQVMRRGVSVLNRET